ncbi:MAG: ATP-dependent Clp protease adapter ClpS [Deltaproteobacteria bacterium]|nr:ATP-dependent Clp protease adapter ClpS [Deltaproteobacteria bacterium]
MTEGGERGGVETLSREKTSLKEPRLFSVILLNDDYTTMDFVVAILESIFHKSPAEAVHIMLAVHNHGRGKCGVYPKQIAEAKIDMVHKRARQEGFPLRCALEEA